MYGNDFDPLLILNLLLAEKTLTTEIRARTSREVETFSVRLPLTLGCFGF
jgi:hypothetical protein